AQHLGALVGDLRRLHRDHHDGGRRGRCGRGDMSTLGAGGGRSAARRERQSLREPCTEKDPDSYALHLLALLRDSTSSREVRVELQLSLQAASQTKRCLTPHTRVL